MLWLATARAEVVSVPMPPVSVAVPRLVAPPRRVAVPDGVPAPGATALTVAVNVTDWPNTDGLTDDVTMVVELAWLTLCVSVGDVLPAKLVSPPYTPVIECAPTVNVVLVNVATPLALSVPVPRTVE